jgi:predicted nucleic acid-binding protein
MSSQSKTYVLDTNIFVGYVRDAPFSRYVDQEYEPLARNNIALVSVVTRGELQSLAYQFNWGPKKKKELQRLVHRVRAVPVQSADVIDRYAEIDAYSQNALPDRPLGTSDRNMGKNDVWIAATASVIEATLLTTNGDFDHLHGEFLHRIHVDPDAEYDL